MRKTRSASGASSGAARSARDAVDPDRALVPAVVRLNERKVSQGFWPKVRRNLGRLPFVDDLLAVWWCVRDPATPAPAKGLMLAALAYFVSPIDAVPDALAGIGFTDDAAVLAAVLTLVGANLKPRHRRAARDWLGADEAS
jgi:uncharacterized membrane protein YkvA (DUF1232 family)